MGIPEREETEEEAEITSEEIMAMTFPILMEDIYLQIQRPNKLPLKINRETYKL